jgi:hypothetical protein
VKSVAEFETQLLADEFRTSQRRRAQTEGRIGEKENREDRRAAHLRDQIKGLKKQNRKCQRTTGKPCRGSADSACQWPR